MRRRGLIDFGGAVRLNFGWRRQMFLRVAGRRERKQGQHVVSVFVAFRQGLKSEDLLRRGEYARVIVERVIDRALRDKRRNYDAGDTGTIERKIEAELIGAR